MVWGQCEQVSSFEGSASADRLNRNGSWLPAGGGGGKMTCPGIQAWETQCHIIACHLRTQLARGATQDRCEPSTSEAGAPLACTAQLDCLVRNGRCGSACHSAKLLVAAFPAGGCGGGIGTRCSGGPHRRVKPPLHQLVRTAAHSTATANAATPASASLRRFNSRASRPTEGTWVPFAVMTACGGEKAPTRVVRKTALWQLPIPGVQCDELSRFCVLGVDPRQQTGVA